MQLGQVVGTVVATRRAASAQDWSLRVVAHLNQDNQRTGTYTVAVDGLGVDDGEVVMVASGSAARQSALTAARPCDAIIMAIVDIWAVGETVRYRKSEPDGPPNATQSGS